MILESESGKKVAFDIQVTAKIRFGQPQRISSEHRGANHFGIAEHQRKASLWPADTARADLQRVAVPQAQRRPSKASGETALSTNRPPVRCLGASHPRCEAVRSAPSIPCVPDYAWTPPKYETVAVYLQLYVRRSGLESAYLIGKQFAYHRRRPCKIRGIRWGVGEKFTLFAGAVARPFNERRDIRMQCLQIRFVGVHHVTGGVEMHFDISLERALYG